MSFVLKDQVKKVPPLGRDIELYRSSSCLGALRSLLNTEGILTLPMFLLSDGSLIQMWSASFAQQCRMLLSLSIIVKSLSSAFGCFVEMWWFLMALVVWNFFQGPGWFHLCITLCSCWLGISSGRLYQFSEHVELDLLDAWVKTWWCWYLYRKLCILLRCVCTVSEAFDVWYDNSNSFYKLFCGWVWLFFGFLLEFALLKNCVG